MDCLHDKTKNADINEKYFIGNYGLGYLSKKGDIFYISIPKNNELITYNLSNKEVKSIKSETMSNVFYSTTGFTVYKNSYIIQNGDFNIIKTEDFVNYKIYSVDATDDIGYIRDITYSGNNGYFLCYSNSIDNSNDFYYKKGRYLTKIIYDESNDIFINKGIIMSVEPLNGNSKIPIIETLVDSINSNNDYIFVFGFIHTIFRYFIINQYKISNYEHIKEISINESYSDWFLSDILYDDSYLYLLSNGGKIGEMYIEKMEIK